MFQPNLNSLASRVPEIIRAIQKNLTSRWISPRSLFIKFLMDFYLDGPRNVPANLKFVAPTVPEITASAVLGGVANPQYWGRGSRKGSRTVPFKRT